MHPCYGGICRKAIQFPQVWFFDILYWLVHVAVVCAEHTVDFQRLFTQP